MREYIFERPDEAEDTAKRDANYRGELIRCRDCKWYGKDRLHCCGIGKGLQFDDDYCSDAEKRKEE